MLAEELPVPEGEPLGQQLGAQRRRIAVHVREQLFGNVVGRHTVDRVDALAGQRRRRAVDPGAHEDCAALGDMHGIWKQTPTALEMALDLGSGSPGYKTVRWPSAITGFKPLMTFQASSAVIGRSSFERTSSMARASTAGSTECDTSGCVRSSADSMDARSARNCSGVNVAASWDCAATDQASNHRPGPTTRRFGECNIVRPSSAGKLNTTVVTLRQMHLSARPQQAASRPARREPRGAYG